MFWHQQQPLAQLIFLNFQNLIVECISHTSPDATYFFKEIDNDFYFASQVPFPSMNGIISTAYDAKTIDIKCEKAKDEFKNVNYPVSWFWPHEIELSPEIEAIFTKHGFISMGKYTSMAVENEKVKNLPIQLIEGEEIKLVENDKQLTYFLEITKNVYGIGDNALPSMNRLYSAYKSSDKIKLYLATVDEKPVATLLSYQFQNTVGLYNAATLEPYRKRGLVTALTIQAVKDAPHTEYGVAQLMAAQMAKGICDKLGFKQYSYFIPLCYGFDLEKISS